MGGLSGWIKSRGKGDTVQKRCGLILSQYDLDIYRKYFYWFQYHFFLRSGYKSRSKKTLFFLQTLLFNADEAHYRWELKQRGQQPQQATERVVKRPPRGMNKSSAINEHKRNLGAMPAKSFQNAYIGRTAKKNSIRHRYMIFDYLRYSQNNNIWKNFNSLYRALIIFDLYTAGYSFDKIAEEWNGATYLIEMNKYRTPLVYEAALKVLGFENKELDIPTNSPLFFTETYDEHDEKLSVRLTKIKIKLHYKRALELIDLAKNGNFSSLSKLPALKH